MSCNVALCRVIAISLSVRMWICVTSLKQKFTEVLFLSFCHPTKQLFCSHSSDLPGGGDINTDSCGSGMLYRQQRVEQGHFNDVPQY